MAKARAADGQMALFRAAILHSSDGQFFVDRNACIRAWNPAAAGILGEAASQAAGQPIQLFLKVGPDAGDLNADRLAGLAGQRIFAMAHPLGHPPYPVELSIIALPGQGFHISVRDLRHAQLADSGADAPAHERDWLEAPIGMAQVAPDGQFLEANRKMCDLLGYPPEALLQCRFQDIVHPDDREQGLAQIGQLLAGRLPKLDVEIRLACRDGTVIWGHLLGERASGASRRSTWLNLTIEDITARRQAEEALRLSREQFRGIFEQAAVGISLSTLDGRLVNVNQKYCDLVGYTGKELEALTYPDITHPDDRLLNVELTAQLLAGKIDMYQMDKRYLRKDGTTIWIQLTTSLRRDSRSGAPVEFIAILEDITDRKRAEAALRDSEERYRLMVETTEEGVWCFDAGGKITFVNQRMAQMLGYDAAELTGRPMLGLVDRESQPSVLAHLERCRQGAREQYDLKLQRQDGHELWAILSASPLFDRQGGYTGALCMLTDITERKRAELLRAEEKRVLEMLAKGFHLHEVLVVLLQAMELQFLPGMATAMLLDETGLMFTELLGPHLPARFLSAHFDLAIGPDVGPCAAAAFYNQAVIVADIDACTQWPDFRELALRYGISACWANPIRTSKGEVLGVLSLNYRQPRAPDARQLELMEKITHLAGIAVERKQSEQQLAHLAQYDMLTGLPNRMHFNSRLQENLAHARRDGDLVAVLLMDLDRFKNINDTLGHHAGDLLLKEVAQRLTHNVRETDTVARLGGDEFVILQTHVHQPEAAGQLAAKLVEAMARPFLLEGKEIHSGASIGIALYPLDTHDGGQLLKQADMAMYKAKTQGRYNYQFYTSDLTAHAHSRKALAGALQGALDRGEFLLHYQPRYDGGGQIISVEALIRWQHPERGLLYPGEFIGLSEEIGLMLPIGAWVLQSACRQVQQWRQQGWPGLRISVNLSAHQLRFHDLPDLVEKALEDTGMVPASLELEITENSLVPEAEMTLRTLQRLGQMGVHLTIDDFGSGYSSLRYLQRLPVQSLKIDSCFIQEIDGDGAGSRLVAATIALAHGMGLKAVAEGVGSQEQVDFLLRHACDELQGYYFCGALPPDELEEVFQAARRRLGDAWPTSES
jgi:diguanylate cyclase (GGDEF)-like protein/PAS domain S-box-containing protein